MARRHDKRDPFHWEPPGNLGEGVNTSDWPELGPAYFEDEAGGVALLFLSSYRSAATSYEILASTLGPDGVFGAAVPVPELNSPKGEQRPSIRHDGLEVFFDSNRTGTLGGSDLWVSTRPSTTAPWSTPENLGGLVNSAASDIRPSISWDGTELYYHSFRDDPAGKVADLYRCTRAKITGRDKKLRLVDLQAIADIAQAVNRRRAMEDRLYTVVDSTFATPFCQRPITLGIDFVVHSLTKAIGGFGTDIGGAVVGPEWAYDMLMLYRKDFGGVLSAKSAWPVLAIGLPSLAVPMRQMQSTSQAVAEFLASRSQVERVSYPGLSGFEQAELAHRQMVDYDGRFAPGSMIYFVMRGRDAGDSLRRAERFINHIARFHKTHLCVLRS